MLFAIKKSMKQEQSAKANDTHPYHARHSRLKQKKATTMTVPSSARTSGLAIAARSWSGENSPMDVRTMSEANWSRHLIRSGQMMVPRNKTTYQLKDDGTGTHGQTGPRLTGTAQEPDGNQVRGDGTVTTHGARSRKMQLNRKTEKREAQWYQQSGSTGITSDSMANRAVETTEAEAK